MLSYDEQVAALAVLEGSPLIAQWDTFKRDYLPRLTVVNYAPGAVIYQPGNAPSHLFILLEGRVIETAAHEGREWFERTIRPGEFFGPHALFSYEYRTTTQVPRDASVVRVLTMSAGDLRVGLERDSSLRDALLREKLSSRLRRVPLLRGLSDDEVRWLAQVVEEVPIEAGDSVPLSEKPGIWIVDYGQLTVTGPANPYPAVSDRWRLTSGNFFVASRSDGAGADGLVILDGLRYGVNCAADTAEAHLRSRLLYVPGDHAARMAEGVPAVAEILKQPIDIVPILSGLPLLDGVSPDHLYHLAQFMAWEFVPAGQNATTQGSVGHSYVILREGAAAIVAFDDQGRERPRNKMFPIFAYGETSLLEGKARDATVRAVKGADVNGADLLTLDRRDLQYAFREQPALWTPDLRLVSRSVKEAAVQTPLPWMQEGEVLYWKGRPHWFWLAGPLLTVGILFVIALLFASVVPTGLEGLVSAVLVVLGLVAVAAGVYAVFNYYDDMYAVTSRRASRQDRQMLVYDARLEAPSEMIQDVTVQTDFWGRVFDYGNVTLRTASKQGSIRFDHVPSPEAVKEFVEASRTSMKAAARGRHREDLRRGLITGLHLALPIPERQRALGEVALPGTEISSHFARLVGTKPGKPIRIPKSRSTRPLLERLTRALPPDVRETLLGPEPTNQTPATSGELVWRKHWLNLLARIIWPVVAFLGSLVAGVFVLITGTSVLGFSTAPLILACLLLLVVSAGWVWWVYEDWKNDLYIVTDDRIIDIEMKPLSLNVKRREGGLDRVQNVIAEQKGIIAAIFGYGDVVITTAAADEGFTFTMVPNAKKVQSSIFQKLDNFRNRQEEKRSVERQREIIEGLEVYHQLRGSPEAPPEWREN